MSYEGVYKKVFRPVQSLQNRRSLGGLFSASFVRGGGMPAPWTHPVAGFVTPPSTGTRRNAPSKNIVIPAHGCK